MQVGSRALVTLRHSFSHFNQIHIVLGAIMVNPEWWLTPNEGDFWKEKFFICKY
jgi:hypothetical protein